jgi:hypothetical protein
MTTTPEKHPVAEDGGNQDKPDQKPASPLGQIAKNTFSVIAGASAVIALIIAIFTWTVLGTSWLVKALFAVSLFTLVAALMCCLSLRKEKQLSLITILAAAGIGVTCTCTTVAVIHLKRSQTTTSAAAVTASEKTILRETTVKFDERSTAANPIIVSCNFNVPVSGHLPNGYDFAVGNIINGKNIGNAEPVYVPDTAARKSSQDSTWLVPVTFGGPTKLKEDFKVSLVVMPAQEMNYLVSEGQETRKIDAQQMLTGDAATKAGQLATEESWWIAAGTPPPPAFTEDTQVYQLNPSAAC